jgi:hypothetical protein
LEFTINVTIEAGVRVASQNKTVKQHFPYKQYNTQAHYPTLTCKHTAGIKSALNDMAY